MNRRQLIKMALSTVVMGGFGMQAREFLPRATCSKFVNSWIRQAYIKQLEYLIEFDGYARIYMHDASFFFASVPKDDSISISRIVSDKAEIQEAMNDIESLYPGFLGWEKGLNSTVHASLERKPIAHGSIKLGPIDSPLNTALLNHNLSGTVCVPVGGPLNYPKLLVPVPTTYYLRFDS